MTNEYIFKRKSRCKCDLLLGMCADINCPRSLNNHGFKNFWIDGWALSKYSAWSDEKTKIGAMIHNIKYSYGEYTEIQRHADVKYLKNQVIDLIRMLYDENNLPFDVCLSPISHVSKQIDIASYICRSISGRSITYVENALTEKRYLGSMKNIPKAARCQKTVGNYVFNCPGEIHPTKGILIIDDVFDTGCTLKGISTAISEAFPALPIFVITVAYIGQMGRISAS